MMRSTCAVMFCSTVALLVIFFAGNQDDRAPKEKEKAAKDKGKSDKKEEPETRAHVEAPPVAFTDLVNDADRIFIGEVRKIRETHLENSTFKDFPVEEVTFSVEKTLKGKPAKELVIRQAKSVGVFREKTGSLLIYLSPDSRIGLTQPIGVYSGYFKILTGKGKKGPQFAINLQDNEGLWGDSKFLLGDEKNVKVLTAALGNLRIDADESKRLYQTAFSGGASGKPLPLNLLVAATMALTVEGKGKEKD